MQQRLVHRGASLAIIGLLGITVLLAGGCSSGGVSQTEYDSLKQQAAEKDKQIADLKAQAAKPAAEAPKPAAGGNVILGAIPNAPPRATPTATPAGFVAPPPPKQVDPEVKSLMLDVRTVTSGKGESKYNVDADKTCVLSQVFKRGMHMVWLMEAYDGANGKELQANDVKAAVVKLPNGQTAAFRYGRHGATDDSPWFWSASWDVPPDFPVGNLEYEVSVTTNSDKTGSYKPWWAVASRPVVIID